MASAALEHLTDHFELLIAEEESIVERWFTDVLADMRRFEEEYSNNHPGISNAIDVHGSKHILNNYIRHILDRRILTPSQLRRISPLGLYAKAGLSTDIEPSPSATLYSPLETHDIRLLTIISIEGSHIVCRLDTYPCWLAPEFDALSYCWGLDTDTASITCNNRQLEIRQNLYGALKYLLEDRPAPNPTAMDRRLMSEPGGRHRESRSSATHG
jgi:hypothetical protein